MNVDQKKAYEWAKTHDYPSIAARYARALATAVDDMQAQLAESQQRERAAVEDLEELLEIACRNGLEGACDYCSDNGENCTSTTGWRGPQEARKGETE